jgi:hypothetical protein
MTPVPAAFDGFIEYSKRVSSTYLINLEYNRFSVPAGLANRVVSLRVYPERPASLSVGGATQTRGFA